MSPPRIVVIGAGIGGLAAAVALAARGRDVTVVERAATPGGKLREIAVGDARIDAGPTVLTLRHVFDELFAGAGASLDAHVTLRAAPILARHAWSNGEHLDLYADLERSTAAVADFAGAAEARRFVAFSARAREVYRTLERPYLRASAASPLSLVRHAGVRGLPALWRIRPFATLWGALGEHFRDPRLRQMFGRYATYCGSSPWSAPATLMLVAHVEREGVWLVDGGMQQLAVAVAELAERRGARFRYASEVASIDVTRGRVSGVTLASGERLAADAVIVNADPAAIASGRFGRAAARAVAPQPAQRRSLSAVTWTLVARTRGFPLSRHSVFFSGDYRAEFDDLFRARRLPRAPTVYVCAQDRDGADGPAPAGAERLLCLVNAPATGDTGGFTTEEIDRCEQTMLERLAHCGLTVKMQRDRRVITTPAQFEQLFPATGGSLYGPATHGWSAAFRRPRARTRLPGLYLCGGGTHPGAGLPMAALSGRMAATALSADLASTRSFHPVAMPGGMSTR